MPFDADGTTFPTTKPAVRQIGDSEFSALIIDGAQPEGRAALARWSRIPDEERAKWGKPAYPAYNSLAEVDAAWEAALAKRGAK